MDFPAGRNAGVAGPLRNARSTGAPVPRPARISPWESGFRVVSCYRATWVNDHFIYINYEQGEIVGSV